MQLSNGFSRRLVYSLVIGILVVTLLTACSSEAAPQAASHPNAASLTGANLSGAGLPKEGADAGHVQAPAPSAGAAPVTGSNGAANAAAFEAAHPALLAGSAPAAPEAEPMAKAPAPAFQPENGVQPAVDLSIPAEPRVGFRAPDFTLQTVDGNAIKLSDLAGRPVVINYWSTWCIPCKTELPILEKLSQEYTQRGLVIISVNAIEQDNLADVQTAMQELGMTFPVLLDQGNQFADAYNALFFPTTFFVDASGVIRHINLGDANEAKLRGSMDQLLAGGL